MGFRWEVYSENSSCSSRHNNNNNKAIKITVTIIVKDTLMLISSTKGFLWLMAGIYIPGIFQSTLKAPSAARSVAQGHSQASAPLTKMTPQVTSASQHKKWKIFPWRKCRAASPGTWCDPVTPRAADTDSPGCCFTPSLESHMLREELPYVRKGHQTQWATSDSV